MEKNKYCNLKGIGTKKYVSVEYGWYTIIGIVYVIFYTSIIDLQENTLIPLFLIIPVITTILVVTFVIPSIYITNNYMHVRKFGKRYMWKDISKIKITRTEKRNVYLNIEEIIVELYLKNTLEKPKIKVKFNRFRSDLISNIRSLCEYYDIPVNSNIDINKYIECQDVDEDIALNIEYDKKRDIKKETQQNFDRFNIQDTFIYKRKNRLKQSVISIIIFAIGLYWESAVMMVIAIFGLYTANYGLKKILISIEYIKFDSRKTIKWSDIEKIEIEPMSAGRGGTRIILKIFLRNSNNIYTRDILKISNKNDLKEKIKKISNHYNIEFLNYVDKKFLEKVPWI